MGTFGVDEARALAAVAHAGQLDKGGHPYLGHVERVAEAVAAHGDHAVMAALLHDVVEDCGIGLLDLEASGVPPEVISAVDALTRRDGEAYLDAVRRAVRHPLAVVVKRADNADNADEGRLARLGAGEAERLRQKYRRARAVLDGGQVEAD